MDQYLCVSLRGKSNRLTACWCGVPPILIITPNTPPRHCVPSSEVIPPLTASSFVGGRQAVDDVVGAYVGSAFPFLVDVAHNDVEVDARALAALTLIIVEATSVNLFRIAGASRASSRALTAAAASSDAAVNDGVAAIPRAAQAAPRRARLPLPPPRAVHPPRAV